MFMNFNKVNSQFNVIVHNTKKHMANNYTITKSRLGLYVYKGMVVYVLGTTDHSTLPSFSS